jgi:hypothetical protein
MSYFDGNLIIGSPGTTQRGTVDIAKIVAMMDMYEIDQALLSHLAGSIHEPQIGNQYLFDACSQDGVETRRIIPVPVVSLAHTPDNYPWSQWQAQKIPLVRICPDFYKDWFPGILLDSMLHEIYKLGAGIQIPIVPFYGSIWVTGSLEVVQRLQEKGWQGLIWLTGLNRNHIAHVVHLLTQNKQVVVDVGNVSTGNGVAYLANEGDPTRLVCGSGFGLSHPVCFREMVEYSGIKANQIEAILKTNARDILFNN